MSKESTNKAEAIKDEEVHIESTDNIAKESDQKADENVVSEEINTEEVTDEVQEVEAVEEENTPEDEKKSKKSSKKGFFNLGNNKEDELTEQLDAANVKVSEINDKYLRLYSEFDNFRKRTIKEKSDIYKTAGEDVIISIISMVDDFERALQNTEDNEENKAHREGLELIYNKFKKILENKNVKEIEAKGKEFDTDLHEAITQIPAPTDDLKGKVVDVIERGYMMNDKVIRFSKVVTGA